MVGAFPGHERVTRLAVERGVGNKVQGDSPCEIEGGESLLQFGGSGTYSIPLESEDQMDPEPAYYFSSGGRGGNHLHEMKHGSSVQWAVPDSFALIQVDGANVDRIFGITHGSCLGSNHGLADENIAFSLCRFEKSTGIVEAIATWNSRYSYDVMDETSALNPLRREYALMIYDSVADEDLLCVVQIDARTWTTHGVPPHANGEIQSMHYDVVDDSLLISIIQADQAVLYHLRTDAGGSTHFDRLGDFRLDSRANQHFTLLSTFDTKVDIEDRSAYYAVLFENSLRQYDVIKTELVPALEAATAMTTETTYVVMADVKMIVSHLYVERPYRLSTGKDSINSPSIIYMGDFERLTRAGTPIEVEFHVDDIDTLDLVNDVAISVLSSDQILLPQDDNLNAPPDTSTMLESSTGVLSTGWSSGCKSMCYKQLTPHRRLLRLTPQAQFEGTVRVTIQVDDGFSTSTASFVLYVSPGSETGGEWVANCTTVAEAEGSSAVLNVHELSLLLEGEGDRGCGWVTRTFNPVPQYTRALRIDNIRAGNPIRFAIQTRDQFNHPVDRDEGYDAFFTATVVLEDQVLDADVTYAGSGGIYVASTALALNQTGTFYVSVEVNFRISNAFTRFTGLQIGGSPYRVGVVANVMDFSNCLIDGMGTTMVKQGTRESFDPERERESPQSPWREDEVYGRGNVVKIVVRDRFMNICPAVGNEHFGISLSWPGTTAALTPSYSQDGVYTLVYWAPNAKYDGTLTVCETSYTPSANDAIPAGWNETVSMHTGAIYYTHEATGAITNEMPHSDNTVGTCDSTEGVVQFSVYALPFMYWKYNRRANTDPDNYLGFDAESSQLFAPTGCPFYDATIPARRRVWDGQHIPYLSIPPCEKAQAGLRYTFYLQTRDEFGQVLSSPVQHWNGTQMMQTPADDFILAQSYTWEQAMIGSSEYYRNGIYGISMNFTRAGFQLVHVLAYGVRVQHSPYEVLVTAGPLSAKASYADGPGTVMAQEGTQNQLELGNQVLIHAMDRFGNIRDTGDDFFALDPLTESSFLCNMEYVGKGVYEARFWWQVQYVQTYEICPRTESQPVGAYDVCLSRCRDNPDDCIIDGHVDDRSVQLVTVFMRPNEGTPFSSPLFSNTICMNDWSDRYACAMYTGAAGVESSFSIEAKNELEFPNYRGLDFYVATLTGEGIIAPIESVYLRIQFYELRYEPVVAGTYQMNLYMCRVPGELWDEDNLPVEDLVEVGPTQQGNTWMCNPEVVGDSPYTVVITPGSASPEHSTYTFPAAFDVGSLNTMYVDVKDAYANTVLIEEAERLLHVSAQQLDSGSVPAEFEIARANSTSGDLSANIDLLRSGWYTVAIELWMVDSLGTVTPTHITNSPSQIYINPGEFSVRHTEIRNYDIGATTTKTCADDKFLNIHAMDEYGNEVSTDGLSVTISTLPAGITTYTVMPVGNGAYTCPYIARLAGDYSVFMEVSFQGQLYTNILGSPYSLIMEPARPNRTITTGDGIAAATAGIQSYFYVELQDEFGNTRHRRDDLRTVLRFQEYHCDAEEIFAGECEVMMDDTQDHHDVSLDLPLVQSTEPEEGQLNWLEYMGLPDHERDRDGMRWEDQHAGMYIGTYTSFKSGTFRPTFDLCPPSTHHVLIDGIWYEDVYMHHHGAANCPYHDANGHDNFDDEYDESTGVPDLYRLDGSSMPFPIAAGSFSSGLSTRWPATTGTTVLGTAGEPVLFNFWLHDEFDNRRDFDDAVIRVQIQETISGSYSEVDADKVRVLPAEYYRHGSYMMSVQIDTSGTFRIVITVAQSTVDESERVYVPAIADEFNVGGIGVSFFIDAAMPSAPQCFAAMETIVKAGDTGTDTERATAFSIISRDRFGNENVKYGNLSWVVTLNGPDTVSGHVDWVWDELTLSGQYRVEYVPLVAGVYQMAIQIDRSGGQGTDTASIYGSPYQILVRASDATSVTSTANGLGVIRTDPGTLNDDDTYDPAVPTTSLFVLSARDAYGNLVTPSDVPLGDPSVDTRISISLNQDCADPGEDPTSIATWRARGCPDYTSTVPMHCPLEYSIVPLGNGNFEVHYSVPYDNSGTVDPESGLGGEWCGGSVVDYAAVYYNLRVMVDGQDIVASPFRIRAGRYEAPSHQPFICTLDTQARCLSESELLDADETLELADVTPSTDPVHCRCRGAYNEEGVGREMVRTPELVLNVEAGQETTVVFQNIYREGAVGCENTECDLTAPDNSAQQYDTLAKLDCSLGLCFSLEAYKLDENAPDGRAFVDLGNRWDHNIEIPADAEDSFRGRWQITFRLYAVPSDELGYTGSNYNIGSYLIAAVSGGEAIDGCPFTVNVQPASADATQSVVGGDGTLIAGVDMQSSLTVVVKDQFGNPRPEGDAVTLEWATDTDPRMDGTADSLAVLDANQRSTCTPLEGSGATCPDGERVTQAECDAAGQDCSYVVLPPRYLLTYSVQRFTPTFASFYVNVNDARSASQAFRVTCSPGLISPLETVVVGRSAVPLGEDVQTVQGNMVAGQSENVFVQAKDWYGNEIKEGGDESSISFSITYTGVAEGDTTESEIVVPGALQDNADGQYRIRYLVTSASEHELTIGVNDEDIPNTPFRTAVTPGALSEAHCVIQAARNAMVGATVSVTVFQRDTFGNDIFVQPAGVFSAGLLGETYTADPMNQFRIPLSTTLVGDHPVNVFYQVSGGARLLVGLAVIPGGLFINFQPANYVPQNTLFGAGVLRTQDCIAGSPAVFYLRTRDVYGNDCDGRLNPTQQQFSAVLNKCNPPTDPACPGLMQNQEVVATTTNMGNGQFKVNYTVATTGFYQLVVLHNTDWDVDPAAAAPLVLPGIDVTRDPDSFVVLSDTAAVPGLCLASDTGQVTAGQGTGLVITARGQTASGEVVVRQGSGDEFTLTLSDGAELEAGQDSVELEYMTLEGITGQYSLTYTAIDSNHVEPSWEFTMDIQLNRMPIAGMPRQVTMVPGPTGALHTFASGDGVSHAVAGTPAQFTVTGRDLYNNVLTECVQSYDALQAWIVVTGNHSNLDHPDGDLRVEVYRTGCDAAVYQMAYEVGVASDDWNLHVEYGLISLDMAPIVGSPFNLQVSSGTISAFNSYVAVQATLDTLEATPTGGFPVGTAGEEMIMYIHAYDYLRNRMTVPSCAGDTTDCFILSVDWCQTSRDLQLLNDIALAECPEHTAAAFHVEATDERSVFQVAFSLTRSGSYSLVTAAEEASGEPVEFGTIYTGFAVDPAAAAPSRTIWNPSETSVADEYVTFIIRARDEFDNMVDNGEQTFDVIFQFSRPSIASNGFVGADPSCSAFDPQAINDPAADLRRPLCNQTWTNDDDEPLTFVQQPEWGDPPGRDHHGPTWVRFDPTTRMYEVAYKVMSGGAATRINLVVYLGGVQCGDPFVVNVRAAQNVAGLCYVMNNATGPPATRALDLSRDLTNLDDRVAGEPLMFYIQSMSATGVRAGFPLCSPEEAAILNAGGVLEDSDCELLDEFDLDAEVVNGANAGYAVGPFAEQCEETACEGADCSAWVENDCARIGQYRMTWQSTVSGLYQLNVLSFGIQIQSEAVQRDRGRIAEHMFTTFMPFQAYILPAAMDAPTSQAFVSHTLERHVPSLVTVIGRDRYGNLLDRDGGQAGGLGVLIQPLCDAEPDSRFENFAYDHAASSTGQFQGLVTPRFGGPSVVRVYYEPSEQNIFNGTLVYQELTTMVKLDLGRPSPNNGELDGGTVVKVPVYGACEWNDEWQHTFSCSTAGAEDALAGVSLGTVPAQLNVIEELEETLQFKMHTGPTAGRILWELRLMSPKRDTPATALPGWSEIVQVDRLDLSRHGFPLRGSDKIWRRVEDVGIVSQHVRPNSAAWQMHGDYYSEDYSCVTIDDRNLAIYVACLQSEPHVDGEPLDTEKIWGLPAGDYEFIGHNVSAHEARIEMVSEVDSPTLNARNVDLLPQAWKEGVWEHFEEVSTYRFSLDPIRAVTCGETPPREAVLGRTTMEEMRQMVRLSVGTSYNTSDELFHQQLWYNPVTVYPSSTFEHFHYYPAPDVDQVRPASSALANATEHWGQDGFQYVYASAAGGMEIAVTGRGFNTGEDTDKDLIRCVYLNKQCSYSNTSDWEDNSECQHNSFDRSVHLEQPHVNFSRPFVMWTDAVYVNDRTLKCMLPSFGTFAGDVILEVTMNAQNIGPSSTWIKVYDVVQARPSVSAIAGGTETVITLANSDPGMHAYCRFGSFIRPDRSIGVLPYAPAYRRSNTEVICVVPDVGSVGVDCLEEEDGCGDEVSLKNAMTDVTVSFDAGVLCDTNPGGNLCVDAGATFCTGQPFFFYKQPEVVQLVPEVGPTSGGTTLRLELRAGEKYFYRNPGTGTMRTAEEISDFSPGAAQFEPACLFTNFQTIPRDEGAIIRPALFEMEERNYFDDFVQGNSNFDRDRRDGTCETESGRPYAEMASTMDQSRDIYWPDGDRRFRCVGLCHATVYDGAQYRNVSWAPVLSSEEGYDPGPEACFPWINPDDYDSPDEMPQQQEPICLATKKGPCHDKSGKYLSQQVVCTTPTNPTPGASYNVDISLDSNSFAYETARSTPRTFGYYADVAIITMDANDQYNAATEFRTAINNGDAVVDVRFAYSCGYANKFERQIRCNFGNQTTKGRVGTLQFGADVTNQIGCNVPLGVNPSTTTIQIALNGVDFTDITTQTAFTYYGTPMALSSAYVTSVWLMDEQYQFTTPAAEHTNIKTLVARVVDEGGNYVSQNEVYGSRPVRLDMTRTFGGVTDLVYTSNTTLSSGEASFEGITLYKPKAGGMYLLKVWMTDPEIDQECPPGHQALVRQHMVDATTYDYPAGPPSWNSTDKIGPSPTGPNQIGCIAPAVIELVVIVGPTDVKNSIIVDGTLGTVPPDVFVNPGSPFSLTVRARDSADNNRIDGGDEFFIWADLCGTGEQWEEGCPGSANETEADRDNTAAAFFNPAQNSYLVEDLEDGQYACSALVRADMQRDESNDEIQIWGQYKLTIKGINSTGGLDHIKGSPVMQVDNTGTIGLCDVDDYLKTLAQRCEQSCSCVGSNRCEGCEDVGRCTEYPAGHDRAGSYGCPYVNPRIDPVDCTLNSALEGASPNKAGDFCLCDPGYEMAEDQSATAGSRQHVVCVVCPRGKFKSIVGNDVKCESCPQSTHTIDEGAVTDDLCICQPDTFKWTWPGAGDTGPGGRDDTGIEWTAKNRQDAIEAYCVDSIHYFPMPKQQTMDLCAACPPCLKCYGNDTIALQPGYWSDTIQPFVAYICMPKTGNADDMCVGGGIHMQGIFDLAHTDDPHKMAHQSYQRARAAVGAGSGADGDEWRDPGDMAASNLCGVGGTGPTCANCDLGYKRDKKSGKCSVCDQWLGLAGINFGQLAIGMVFAGAAIAIISAIFKHVSPKDILKMKILISFGQVLQSFASTYNVTWPPELKAFIANFDILNFDIFQIGSLECEFPGIKNYYTRFWTTVAVPIGFSALMMIMFKSKMKAVHLLRKSDYDKSALEVKIEDIKIQGNFISRIMAVLIFMYLKVSQTVLDMFKCRDFAPSPDYNGPLATNKQYLQVDLTLSCVSSAYSTHLFFGWVFTVVYPLGIPGGFAFLLFRERDQIHDAINKKKYGFLFKDYAAIYFFWEIWDLMRKLSLSGMLVFFNPGSVAQVIAAMMIALFALQFQLFVMPYQDALANWIQILSFTCIFFTLFGALITKVDVDPATDPHLKGQFVNIFLVFVNSSVPLIVLWTTAYSVAYDFYMTSAGQRLSRTVYSGHRATLGKVVKKAENNKSKASGTFVTAGIGASIKLALAVFWKREDIEAYMLQRELEMVRERRDQRDQARILLAEAKLVMHEKREWLRFLQKNSANDESFRDLMETESIDIYKRLILGLDVNEDKTAVWGDFAGEELDEAYENPVFQRRYKLSDNILTVEELERTVRTEFRLMR
jgi:hypothetical protein